MTKKTFPVRTVILNNIAARWACIWMTLAVLAACADDSIEPPTGSKLNVCHRETPGALVGSLLEIRESQLAAHVSHGDYAATLVVGINQTTADGRHFRTITKAVEAARAGRLLRSESATALCRVTIEVGPGIYTGTVVASSDPAIERFPIVIDVPDISVVGSFKMGLDAGGRATGVAATADVSTITASPPLVVAGSSSTGISEELFILNSTIAGQKADGAVIEGFVMKSGHAGSDSTVGGQGVLSLRTTRIVIRNNKFEGNFTERIDLRSSSAVIEKNHSSGPGNTCDICVAGPGTYSVLDNRILEGGGIPGILSVPATLLPVPASIEQDVLPPTSSTILTITNNEVRGHQRVPVGVGIRIASMGLGAPNVSGLTKATISGNTVINNRFGMIFEAGFPVASGSLRGDLDIVTSGNTFTNSCQNNVLIAFTRHATALGVNVNPYLKNSIYVFTFGADVPFANAWYAHAANQNNTLTVNGATIATGARINYDATKVCPQS